MHSVCFVVLPDDLSLDDSHVYAFVRNHIIQYYSELQVEPYKKFFTKDETIEIAKRKGFDNIADFEEYLKEHRNDDGIENGLYYWVTTFNPQGHWDSIRLNEIKKIADLESELPYSVVTLDGTWHSESDYEYKPILDFELGSQHLSNIEPEKMWKYHLDNIFYNIYSDKNVAVISVHS